MDVIAESTASTTSESLVFAVNGERFDLPNLDPSTTLFEFLRTRTRFKSVKLGCGEGGCGACVVLVSKYDRKCDKVEDFTVSSCLTLVRSVNRCSITTSEGLGNLRDGFHPIHERFAGFHASQCGFCTPGMCLSLASAIAAAERKDDRPEPPHGFSKLTVSEAERANAGNLCRCTGYRSIADVCKSFAADFDIEDLGYNTFWAKGQSKDEKAKSLPFYDRSKPVPAFPEFLKEEAEVVLGAGRWLSPRTIEELKSTLSASIGMKTNIVVGNTGTGYYKEIEHYDKYVDLKHLPELSVIRKDSSGFDIGSAVSIAKVIETLRDNEFPSGGGMVFRKLGRHIEKIASPFVRNSASIGGNLVMAQRRGFPSDLATILLAVDATVEIMTSANFPGRKRLTLEEFLESPPLEPDSVLLSIKIPNWESSEEESLLFETYRAAPRPLGNALPYMNAAFLAKVSPCGTHNGFSVVTSCRLAFGAYGTDHAIRAREVEEFFCGKVLNHKTLHAAFNLVRVSVVSKEGTTSPAYRSSLAVAYLFKFFSPIIDAGTSESISNQDSDSHGRFVHRKDMNMLLSSGKQFIGSSSEYYPVGEPVAKSGAALQASGEAVYVDDIPSPPSCLYGSFVYSTEPLARVKGIRFEPMDQHGGTIDIITFRDIPEAGENVGNLTSFGSEPLFAENIAECAGQPIALLVADTQKHADMAAKLAVVDYGFENVAAPILTVKEAVERSSFFEIPSYLMPKPVGDISKGMGEADQKIVSAEIKLGSQYYFYMETQTALAIPDEDNCMVVYSSSQCPEYLHRGVAKCLGVPQHNVRVITRRIGGGYGGKAMKSMPVATACAVAAHKLGRPVRTYVNRKSDMIMTAGRHPMEISYTIGFKSDGKITALDLKILMNAGMSTDISPIMPSSMIATIKKYDWGALSFDIKVCKTNLSSKSAMRAPGHLQGSFIAEAIIEHVASFLSVEVDSVRHRNLHSFESLSLFYGGAAGEAPEYTLPSMWDKLAVSSSFEERTRFVDQFNSCSKWVKRGISRVPIMYQVSLRATPGKVSILNDGSVAVEVGGVEMGQGLWTKVKQAAAYALSLISCNGSNDLFDKVRVIQTDTLSMIQGGLTAGSTTSESSCEAVRLCCNALVERLTPLKESLEKETGSIKWEALISRAHMTSVNMSANSLYLPELSSMRYLIYGAAVSEVEINLLTGETAISQVDIIYDCGQSLNPAVDLGQIEGAFVQGIGFFMLEEYLTDSKGLVVSDSTWTYKIPSMDNIPRQFNVEVLNSGHHKKRILSSKASGEPPLLLASSVHCATRAAVKEARRQYLSWSGVAKESDSVNFQHLDVPATLPVVKELCGLDMVERYLEWILSRK